MTSNRPGTATTKSSTSNSDSRQASPSVYGHPDTLFNDGPYAAISRSVPYRSLSKAETRKELNNSPARSTRTATPTNMHPTGRHGSAITNLDARVPYIPGPPPPQQTNLVSIPPPPPRPPPSQTSHGMIPPPPGPYPGPSSANISTAWAAHTWNRAAIPPPPPPPMQMNHSGIPSFNSSHIFHQQQAQQPLLHRSTLFDGTTSEIPLTSATYIPGTDSFGPGVGIPGLGSHDFNTSDYDVGQNNDLGQAPDGTWLGDGEVDLPGYEDTVVSGNKQPQLTVRGNQTSGYGPEMEKSWTTDRVQAWLASNGFSNTWQRAFKQLMIHGAAFLDIGLANNGRGDFEKMHNHIYPALKHQCQLENLPFDNAKEREEVKRIRKLVRHINDGSTDTRSNHGRTSSATHFTSVGGSETGAEGSPRLETPSTAGGGEESPGLGAYFRHPTSATSTRSMASFRGNLYSSGTATSSDSNITDGTSSSYRQGVTRDILRDNFSSTARKHSPSGSTDNKRDIFRRQEDSQAGSPSLQSATLQLGSSNSYRHQKNGSNDTASQSGPPSSRSAWFDVSGKSREGIRPPPVDTSNRNVSEGFSTPKDHKGLLGLFRKRKKDDGTISLEDQESPTSPIYNRGPSSPNMGRSSLDYNDSSTDRPGSAQAGAVESKDRGRHIRRQSTDKKYVFATDDGLNFRLVNVTSLSDAAALRQQLCKDLKIADIETAQIFATEPGQSEHHEELTDNLLLKIWKSKVDRKASLKFYIKSDNTSTPASASMLTSNSMSMQEKGSGSSLSNRRARPDDLVLHGGFAVSRSTSSPKLSANSPLEDIAKDRLHELVQNMSSEERDAYLQVAKAEYQKEVEKKQKAYLDGRQAKFGLRSPGESSHSIRRGKVIDFDTPRSSPYEEKKQDPLVPLRRPPPAPAESKILTKTNSLSKKAGEKLKHELSFKRRSTGDALLEDIDERGRRQAVAPSPSMSAEISAQLAESDQPKISSSLGTSINVLEYKDGRGRPKRALESIDFGFGSRSRGDSPGGSPSSPGGFTRGKNNMIFTIPDYESPIHEDPQELDGYLHKPSIPSIEKLRRPSPSISPNTTVAPSLRPNSLISRRSYGPAYAFEEAAVEFVKPSGKEPDPVGSGSDSDSDSDDGLFAKPIKAKDGQDKATASKNRKPALNLDTREQKVRSVTWAPIPGTATANPNSENNEMSGTGDSSGTTISPDSAKMSRRKSLLMRDDVWANRPPTEALINDLDTYFPNIDLDQPVLQESVESPPPSPSVSTIAGNNTMSATASNLELPTHTIRPPSLDQGLTYLARPLSIATQAIEEESEDFNTLGSDESTLRGPSAIKSLAQRNVRKSGGLGRMKSIREVAQVANTGVRRQPSKALQPQKTSIDLSRRKSTKMFGANIVQINPGRGSRMSLIDAVAAVPPQKRNNTYRVIRGQLIGKGTYGRVYVGINTTNGEVLAIKQVEVSQKAKASEQGALKDMVASLDLEIDTMQHLEHPNIVQYLGCERKEFSISIFLEYISGGSIGSCLRKHGKFEERVVSSLTRQVLAGLAYLHGQGILHRDLKADNILLDQDGTCKISDFGISKRSDNIYGNDATFSMQGSVFWMAPEVIQSQGKGYSAKVDIWSLGCVVLEMFAGRRPWAKEEAIGAIYKLGSLGLPPPIPEDVSSTISPAGYTFMLDCFQKDPGERPTAETLASHPFCEVDPYYNFLDTDLHAKLRDIKEFR